MKTIALIPARAGSKGLPNKNIRNIAGKPLIGWSIEQAFAAKDIDEVYVSTNCTKIAKIAESFGAKVPFLRPEAISGDEAITEDTVIHFLSFLQKSNISCDNLLLIQCTSPVRQSGRFDDAIQFFDSNKYDSILSVSESHRFYWRNLKEPVPLYNFQARPLRQNISKDDLSYFETGSFYLFKKDVFLRYKNRICGSVGLYVTPENEMFDIDGITDFSICEALLNIEKRVQTVAA